MSSALVVLLFAVTFAPWPPSHRSAFAQEADAEATISALQTQVAELESGAAGPTPQPSPEPATAPVNLQLILDISGSMAQVIPPGETRMDAAKRVLSDVVAGIPDRDGINVGLRIYGHEGDNTLAGAAISCQSSELVVPMSGVDKDALNREVAQLQPTGWTPIGLSLERAGADFAAAGDAALNYIVLVTDGLETCGGDPVQVAGSLHKGDDQVITSVVGFGLTDQEQMTIAQIAQAGGGDVLSAADAAELSDALFAVLSTPVPDIQTPTPAPRSADPGTRENPLPLGTSAEIGGAWAASVIDVIPDATQMVLDRNRFNDPPDEGYQFFIVTIAATYEGEFSSTLPAGNTFHVVGESAVAYDTFNPSCGVIPNDYGWTEVFPGGTIEFNVCFQVRSTDASSLVMFTEDFIEFDRSNRVWFALS
ncbi:MAG: VWA domain-containing protein [Thermomicrobiales bacterium]|nr:VWA domain-containing protein [Thermomicrobiales bacterium]